MQFTDAIRAPSPGPSWTLPGCVLVLNMPAVPFESGDTHFLPPQQGAILCPETKVLLMKTSGFSGAYMLNMLHM